MTEELSQDEIDQLLSTLDDIETEAVLPGRNHKIKIYNFKRPDRFPKNQSVAFKVCLAARNRSYCEVREIICMKQV